MHLDYSIEYVRNSATKNLTQTMFRLGRIFNVYHLDSKEVEVSNCPSNIVKYLGNVINFLENGLTKYQFGNEYNKFLWNHLKILKDLETIFSSETHYDIICVMYPRILTKKLVTILEEQLQDFKFIMSVIYDDKLKLDFNYNNSYSFKNIRTTANVLIASYMMVPFLFIEKIYMFPKSIRNKRFIAQTIHSLCQLKGVENLNYLYLENPLNTLNTYSFRSLNESINDFKTNDIQDFLGLNLAQIIQG